MSGPRLGRIVIAEDEKDIRRLIRFTLQRRGYDVLEATDGEEALALIQMERPPLAILDVMMPGMTGLDVARSVMADPETAGTRVILLSAKGQTSEIEKGLVTGAAAYLVKPFAPRELAARVAEILAQRTPYSEARR